jgi:hypothetical protein
MIETRYLNNIGELIDFSTLDGERDPSYTKRMFYTFRGQKNANYQLVSSLKRNSGQRKEYTEHRLLSNFRKYGQIIDPRICSSIWENMIIAQHHGVPTRLLDFSLSPLIALHFATCGIHDSNVNEDSVVWVISHWRIHELLPEKYRIKLREHNAVSFTIEMLREMNITIDEYSKDMSNSSLVFLEPPSIDDRIVNQFSHFALIPDALDPMDDFLERISINRVAYKFIIPHNKAILFREQLDAMNITERVLFPGLDGLSTYLKRRYYNR